MRRPCDDGIHVLANSLKFSHFVCGRNAAMSVLLVLTKAATGSKICSTSIAAASVAKNAMRCSGVVRSAIHKANTTCAGRPPAGPPVYETRSTVELLKAQHEVPIPGNVTVFQCTKCGTECILENYSPLCLRDFHKSPSLNAACSCHHRKGIVEVERDAKNIHSDQRHNRDETNNLPHNQNRLSPITITQQGNARAHDKHANCS